MRGLVWNTTRLASVPTGMVEATGMLPTGTSSRGRVTPSRNVALNAGSSQPGNIRLASATSNCVTSMRALAPDGLR